MTYYCVIRGSHVYFSPNMRRAEIFRDKHAPGQELLVTAYPHTYGFAHRIQGKRS
jgi:hypothetical protein